MSHLERALSVKHCRSLTAALMDLVLRHFLLVSKLTAVSPKLHLTALNLEDSVCSGDKHCGELTLNRRQQSARGDEKKLFRI